MRKEIWNYTANNLPFLHWRWYRLVASKDEVVETGCPEIATDLDLTQVAVSGAADAIVIEIVVAIAGEAVGILHREDHFDLNLCHCLERGSLYPAETVLNALGAFLLKRRTGIVDQMLLLHSRGALYYTHLA